MDRSIIERVLEKSKLVVEMDHLVAAARGKSYLVGEEKRDVSRYLSLSRDSYKETRNSWDDWPSPWGDWSQWNDTFNNFTNTDW